MDREMCLNQIVENGMEVFVALRKNRFPKKHSERLVQALREYRDLIRGERKIEREVAASIRYLEIAFIMALDSAGSDKEEQNRIGELHQEVVPIIEGIINPESDFFRTED